MKDYAAKMGKYARIEMLERIVKAHHECAEHLEQTIAGIRAEISSDIDALAAMREEQQTWCEREMQAAIEEADSLMEAPHTEVEYLHALARVRASISDQTNALAASRLKVIRLGESLYRFRRSERALCDALDGKKGIPL